MTSCCIRNLTSCCSYIALMHTSPKVRIAALRMLNPQRTMELAVLRCAAIAVCFRSSTTCVRKADFHLEMKRAESLVICGLKLPELHRHRCLFEHGLSNYAGWIFWRIFIDESAVLVQTDQLQIDDNSFLPNLDKISKESYTVASFMVSKST